MFRLLNILEILVHIIIKHGLNNQYELFLKQRKKFFAKFAILTAPSNPPTRDPDFH
jgi:hypothetical protein